MTHGSGSLTVTEMFLEQMVQLLNYQELSSGLTLPVAICASMNSQERTEGFRTAIVKHTYWNVHTLFEYHIYDMPN